MKKTNSGEAKIYNVEISAPLDTVKSALSAWVSENRLSDKEFKFRRGTERLMEVIATPSSIVLLKQAAIPGIKGITEEHPFKHCSRPEERVGENSAVLGRAVIS